MKHTVRAARSFAAGAQGSVAWALLWKGERRAVCDPKEPNVVMNWDSFTPWSALAGGALIGVAASVLLALSGRVAGISGVVGGLLVPKPGEISWRVAFVLGLAIGGFAMLALRPDLVAASPRALPLVAVAGSLVGVGTRLGNGCTSGHGVCGLSRLSIRSLVATLTFMGTGILAASAARVLGAGT